jgi:alkanesulfonate monooxygenase SsuD/methylene tetrahydromethanopterin reductase-like flavin-dependent oxidoreductase (luciferase family)
VPFLSLRLDLRAPDWGAPIDRLYAEGLEMAEWADRNGFEECVLSEHHATEDGYLPSPLVYGAAVAARTQHLRIHVSALILSLHDPVKVAEDIAVLDLLSGGRLELVMVGGFVPSELAMFGRSAKDRGRLVEEGIAVLDRAWTGEPFEYRGRAIRVTPRPLQRPRPPIFLGGSTHAAARRAAHIADGFIPVLSDLYPAYVEECRRIGRTPGRYRPPAPFGVYVTKDPERTWARIAPHALHEANSYAGWYAEAGVRGLFAPFEDAEVLRASGMYPVVTPDECVELAASLGDDAPLNFHPLVGGLDPAVSWESLELFGSQVLPRLRTSNA